MLTDLEPHRAPRTGSPSNYLEQIDRLTATLRLELLPSITKARKALVALAEREQSIDADLRALRVGPDEISMAAAYLDGAVTVDDLAAAGLRSAIAQDTSGTAYRTAARIVDTARRQLGRTTHATMAAPGDDWLRALQPEFDRRRSAVLAEAAAVPGHVVDDISGKSHSMKGHREWDRYIDALTHLDALYDQADKWRAAAIVPLSSAAHSLDLRWSDPSILEGRWTSNRHAGFVLHNLRQGATLALVRDSERIAPTVEDPQQRTAAMAAVASHFDGPDAA